MRLLSKTLCCEVGSERLVGKVYNGSMTRSVCALTALLALGLDGGYAFQAGGWMRGGRAGRPESRSGAVRACMQIDPVVANMVMGTIAGTVSNMAVFPFELVKTRMQTAEGAEEKEKFRSLAASVATITKEGGVPSLWRGSLPVLLGGGPESALQLAAHSWMVTAMLAYVGVPGAAEGDLPWTFQALAGAVSGAATLPATQPMEVLRLRDAAGDTRGMGVQLREMGLAGVFQSAEATLLRDIPWAALYFPLYCHCKTVAGGLFAQVDVPHAATLSFLAAGIFSGALATYLLTPADLIKTRIQSQLPKPASDATPLFSIARLSLSAAPGANLAPRYVTAFATNDETPQTSGLDKIKTVFKKTVAAEGWGGLMTGAEVRVMKSAPKWGLKLMMYETMQQVLLPLLKSP